MKNYGENKIAVAVNKAFYKLGLNKDNERAGVYAEEIFQESCMNDGNVRKMFMYVKEHYTGYNYPPVDLFLKGLGYVSNKDKFKELANKAWARVAGILPQFAGQRTWGAKCEDQCTAYALNQIGIDMIRSVTVGGIPNTIPAYHLSRFEKQFKESYISACNDKSKRQEIAGDTGYAKKRNLSASYLEKEDRVLLGMNESRLLESK